MRLFHGRQLLRLGRFLSQSLVILGLGGCLFNFGGRFRHGLGGNFLGYDLSLGKRDSVDGLGRSALGLAHCFRRGLGRVRIIGERLLGHIQFVRCLLGGIARGGRRGSKFVLRRLESSQFLGC